MRPFHREKEVMRLYSSGYCYRCQSAGSVELGICQICGMEYPPLPPGQMPTPSFLATPSGTEVKLKGEIDLATRGMIEGQLMEALEGGRGCFLVDLNEVDFMDTQGIHMLLRLQRRARELGRDFVIRCERGPCLRVLEAMGLRAMVETAA